MFYAFTDGMLNADEILTASAEMWSTFFVGGERYNMFIGDIQLNGFSIGAISERMMIAPLKSSFAITQFNIGMTIAPITHNKVIS